MPFAPLLWVLMPHTDCRRSGRGAASLLGAALASVALLLTPGSASAQSVVAGRPVSTVSVTTNEVAAIPKSFLGFSMNVEEMEGFTNLPAFDSILNNLLNTDAVGNGPFVLRLGGTYVDSSYWENDESQVLPIYQANPAFTVTLNQAWMNSLASTVQQTGSKVILNVNAVAHDPNMAADEIADAEQTLPKGSLLAVAIGNEPDDYNNPIIPVARSQSWARSLTPANYASLFANYARTLRARFPGITLAGPEATGASTDWTSELLQRDAGLVGLATSHVYPLNACAVPGQEAYPTIAKYLQNWLYQSATQGLSNLLTLAQRLHISYRLTELGSGTCGGVSGVNNTFATSLWVINQLFSFVSAGLDGVNVHLRADTPNTAIMQSTSSASGLEPEPLLYGLAAFVDALEPNDVLTQASGQIQPNVSVWPVYGSDGWHVALVNYTSSPQLVELSLPATGTMTVTPLTAPTPWSTDPTFGGQTITDTGTWSGPLSATDSLPTGGVYKVVLAPTSAAIADVQAAPGTTITALKKSSAKRTTKKKPARKKTARKKTAKKPARAKSRKSGQRRRAAAPRRR